MNALAGFLDIYKSSKEFVQKASRLMASFAAEEQIALTRIPVHQGSLPTVFTSLCTIDNVFRGECCRFFQQNYWRGTVAMARMPDTPNTKIPVHVQ